MVSNTEPVKHYLLDTNVLLHSPDSLFSFAENEVVLPLVVLDEIDTFKKGSTELNRNARVVIRYLDELRASAVEQGTSLQEGVKLDNGGTLRIDLDPSKKNIEKVPHGFKDNVDNAILATALAVSERNPDDKVIVVTKDVNVRVKADAMNLIAEDYKKDQVVNCEDGYTGFSVLDATDEEYGAFFEERLTADELGYAFFANEYFILQDHEASPLIRYDQPSDSLVRVGTVKDVFGLKPLNREQRIAIDLLLNDSINLVTLQGKAGTGKTLLAMAAGLQRVVDDGVYRKLIIYRPVIPMGKDIGFLPGSELEKLTPWMQPIYDNMEFLCQKPKDPKAKPTSALASAYSSGKGFKQQSTSQNTGMDYFMETGQVDIRALTYIRGRSLPEQYIIVDEAQNLTPHEAKTIITRAGKGTKIVFTGDPNQIDNPYVDSTSNGLSYVIEKFKNHSIAGHIALTKGERSPLAELAATIMDNC